MASENTMDIWAHLEELRKNLLRALIGLALGITLAFFITGRILDFLAQPVGGIENLQAIEVTETVSVYMRVALLVGLIISLPWIFYQLFDFIRGLDYIPKNSISAQLPKTLAKLTANLRNPGRTQDDESQYENE